MSVVRRFRPRSLLPAMPVHSRCGEELQFTNPRPPIASFRTLESPEADDALTMCEEQAGDVPTLRRTEIPVPALARTESLSSTPPALNLDVARKHYPALTKYLEKLEAAYKTSTSLWPVEDVDHLPDIIAGLNAADPELRLHFEVILAEDHPDFTLECTPARIRDSALAKHIEAELLLKPGQRSTRGWRALIDDGGRHRVAMDVQCSKSSNDVSIIVIDSLNIFNKWDVILNVISSSVQSKIDPSVPPVRLHLAFFDTQTQRTDEGCDIFALSAAKKMAADPTIRALHDRLLEDLASDRIKPGGNILTAARQLPPSLFKHATSRRVLENYLDMQRHQRDDVTEWAWHGFMQQERLIVDPDGMVNKQGQTLLQRYDLHETERADPLTGMRRKYSTSYEDKRIKLIRTALAHLTRDKAA